MVTKVGEIIYEVAYDTRPLIDGQRAVDREVDKTVKSFNAITLAIKAYAAALTALKIIELTDQFRLLQTRVEVAAGSMEAGSAAMAELLSISKRTQTSVEGNAQVFQRLNQSLLQMGGTQADTLRLTELLAKAIKVSGASAVEAKAAMLQFGQALGSGKLAGDELRSLLENAPYLMRQLADGLGVPIGALKQLGEEGKLTADVVVNALSKSAERITADFAKFPLTFDAAMTGAIDAFTRMNAQLDEATGNSAAATGIVKGAGEAFDDLAEALRKVNGESEALSRSETIRTWSDATRTALSYVVDAADLTWQTLSVLGRNVKFVFETLGSQIGGLAAMATAAARGEFNQARAIWREIAADDAARRKALDEADAKTLSRTKLLGQQMRESMATETAARRVEDRGYVPNVPGSKLKPPKGAGDGFKKLPPDYLNDGLDKLDEQLRQKYDKIADSEIEAEQRAREKVEEERKRAVEYAAQITKAINPVDALRQEYEAKLSVVQQYEQLMAAAGVNVHEQSEIARTQISREYDLQRRALAEQSFRSQSDANALLIDSINALSTSASGAIVGLINGTMTASDVMRGFANVILNEAVGSLVQVGVQMVKNALLGDTLAAADKARKVANGAVYAASVSAQVAGMSALAAQNAFAATAAIPLIGPALAPAAAAAAAAAATALGSPALATAPIAGARQYGGPTTAGQLYRINERGRPEMFTAANGSQYMLPTSNGNVTPANQVGAGAGGWTINVHNAPAGTTATVNNEARIIDIACAQMEARLVDQFGNNSGPAWNALRGASNVQGRLS